MPGQYRFKSAFQSELDEFMGTGKRPVVLDIIAPDRVTSMLPPGLKMVLHTNPQSMQFSYAKTISRQQTMAGWVEYHWGSNPTEISFSMATGGFMRLYTGLSNITGPTPSNDKLPKNMMAVDVRGTRRETIAYDKYLDFLALFHNNGAIYDARGTIAFQGQILITYDAGSWWGWFTNFSVEETAEKPYQFTLSATFSVDRELHRLKSVYVPPEQRRATTSGATTPSGAASSTPSTTPTTSATQPWNDDLTSADAADLGFPTNADETVPSPPDRSAAPTRSSRRRR